MTRWAALDYRTIEEPNAQGAMEWVIARHGIGHGLAAGFDRVMIDGVETSNAPDRPEALRPTLITEPVFFPWSEPGFLDRGDGVTVHITAVLVREDHVWSWRTHIRSANGDTKATFDQSTFYGAPLSLDALKKRASRYVPTLTGDGQMMLLVLSMMATRQAARQIARQLFDSFPTRFNQPADALAFVSDVLAQYG